MKKSILFLLISTSAVIAPAQCISFTENGFENWVIENDTTMLGQPFVYEHPKDTWFSMADIFGFLFSGTGTPVLNKTTDKNSGTYAMKMIATKDNDGDLIGLGAITSRPKKITGYFKYNGGASDSLSVFAYLVNGSSEDFIFGGDTSQALASAIMLQKSSVSTYTKFSIDFKYKSAAIPDSFAIMMVLNNHNNGDINAWFDDICFEGVTGIEESEFINNLQFFNPGDDRFQLSMSFERPLENFQAHIFDLSGREVFGKVLNNGAKTEFMDEFDLAGLNSGIYLLQLQNGELIIGRKFYIQ